MWRTCLAATVRLMTRSRLHSSNHLRKKHLYQERLEKMSEHCKKKLREQIEYVICILKVLSNDTNTTQSIYMRQEQKEPQYRPFEHSQYLVLSFDVAPIVMTRRVLGCRYDFSEASTSHFSNPFISTTWSNRLAFLGSEKTFISNLNI